MTHYVELVNAEAIPTAVIRNRVIPEKLSQFVPAACGEVWSFIRSSGIPRSGRHVALYLEDGEVEVGAEVSERFVGNDRVHYSQLPAGRAAMTTHFGPYSRLGDAHSVVRSWCEEQGYQLSGVCWEIYGHWDESWNADPSKIRTDVFHLLKSKGPNDASDALRWECSWEVNLDGATSTATCKRIGTHSIRESHSRE